MYNLNINKSSVVPTNLIVGRVLDKPFDTFQFKIFDGLDPLDLTGATLDFRGVTPDNKKVISTNVKITDASSGEIEFQLPTNFYSAQGQFRNAYFRINKSGLTESTNDLLINVLNAVDLNLDDSKIIIDQLDKIIEDAIEKLDKELAGINAQLQKEKENIAQLQKDVASYRQSFDKQMADMQKQIDDLRSIINSTDIQRPQITSTSGNYLVQLDDSTKTTKELLTGIPNKLTYVAIRTASDTPENWIVGLLYPSITGTHRNFIGNSTIGILYHYSTEKEEWNRVGTQYAKLTDSNGLSLLNISEPTKTTQQILSELPRGVKFITMSKAKDLPENDMYGYITTNSSGGFKSIICCALSGGTYSYSTINQRWSKLDGQVPKITNDDGTAFVRTIKPVETYITESGKGLTSVRLPWTNTDDFVKNGFPPNLGHGVLLINNNGGGTYTIILIGTFGGTYSGVYNFGKFNGWKRLDGQDYKITDFDGTAVIGINAPTQTTKSKLSELGKGFRNINIVKTIDSPESNLYGLLTTNGDGTHSTFIGTSMEGNTYKYSTYNDIWVLISNKNVANLLNQEAYYGVDGFLLDKLTNYEFVDVTANLSGNSVTTRYKVSPDVDFNIPLTNVYNDTSSTGFEVWEIQGSINDTRVTVSRSKGVKVGNTTTASNNTSDIKIVGVYGVNKIK